MASDTSHLLVTEAHLALDEARRQKAERIKSLGSPIQLPGKALSIIVRGGDAWVAENTHVIKKIDLESGNTLQVYRGHTGPVTCIAHVDDENGKYLISGSWDQTIKIWNTNTKALVSSTDAHTDFVKALHVIPSIQLLISAGSDKIVRLWDLSKVGSGQPLACVGTISSHTRPVETLDGQATSATNATVFTADTMGIIKVWELTRVDEGDDTVWRASLKKELTHHRTRINEILYGSGYLWTASADETVQVVSDAGITDYDGSVDSKRKVPLPHLIHHPTAVRCILPLSITDLGEPYILTGAGDSIRVYDISSPEEPELINEMDAHWHDVTALRLWVRRYTGDDEKQRVEPWIISASLDGTIRKWRLTELMKPVPSGEKAPLEIQEVKKDANETQFQMSEEEERELAELMDE